MNSFRLRFLVSFFTIFAPVCFPSVSFSQVESLILKKYDLQSEIEDPQLARKDIIEKAYLQATEEILAQVFDLQSQQISKEKIQQTILKSSSKYIPYLKSGSLVHNETTKTYSMSVEVRLSVENLRRILKQSGLIQSEQVQRSMVSMIRFEDRVGGDSYLWWEGEPPKTYLKKISSTVEKSLQGGLLKSGFFLFPFTMTTFSKMLPQKLVKPKFETQELVQVARFLKSGIVLDGYVYILKDAEKKDFRLDLKITAIETGTSKVIAEVSRRYFTGKGDYEKLSEQKLKKVIDPLTQDLVSQIVSSLEQGTLGYELTELTFKGPWLIKDHELIKTQLKDQVALIRSVKERMISNQEIVFEVASPLTSQKLSEKLTLPTINGRGSRVEAVSDHEVILKVY